MIKNGIYFIAIAFLVSELFDLGLCKLDPARWQRGSGPGYQGIFHRNVNINS